jgi:NAD(P)H-dependent FMN reductase
MLGFSLNKFDMENKTLKIKIIAGSTREGRFSDQAGNWVKANLDKQENIEVEVIDLRDFEMPFFDSPVSPAYKQEPYRHEAVARFTDKIAEADAYIIITPEYNHSTSGVLKNALDWVYGEWTDKPVAFVAYGSVGGARAVEQLRLIAIELQMAPIREAVHFLPGDFFPVHMGSAPANEMFARYEEKLAVMLKQLLRWTTAFKTLRG